ncbi:hypothetical protein KDE13_07640 [Campylobacter sp. faydin G-140]|uniref:hypothetical protein n=1 Tax=Campylobacter anatolicus TaxID=2829105 RepID=UPI001B940A13|nr:hypothetical protein [Campylobacter anatolicus]MBR8461507.1 hypothetical protein [Campylobacter anatolicus]MBR8466210.1 hypothetical protein [Campylobacter anatolicus]
MDPLDYDIMRYEERQSRVNELADELYERVSEFFIPVVDELNEIIRDYDELDYDEIKNIVNEAFLETML